MEDTLRVLWRQLTVSESHCLNPCFNGRYSQSLKFTIMNKFGKVLILVLMEDTLRGVDSVLRISVVTMVLILVLMEDTLRG